MKKEAIRTNIVINDELMAETMKLSGLKTKKKSLRKGRSCCYGLIAIN